MCRCVLCVCVCEWREGICRFIRTEEDDVEEDEFHAWRKRMARKYYDKLFKEFCVADLSLYKEGKVRELFPSSVGVWWDCRVGRTHS